MEKMAHLVSDVLQGLGHPDESLLHPADVVRAVRASLAFFDLTLGQSNQNHGVSSKTFTAATREKLLADVAGVPLWVERRAGVAPNEVWPTVLAVNLASIEEAAARGEARCAFSGQSGGTLRVRFSFLPSASDQFRLWYDPDPALAFSLDDPLRLPGAYYPMFSSRALLDCLPVMMSKLAEQGEEVSEARSLAWAAAKSRAEDVLRDFAPLWRQHRLGSRGGGRGRDRRRVLSRSGRGM